MRERFRKMTFYGILLILAGILYFIFCQGTGFAVPCFFHTITGLYCPGCGMTRCIIHLLSFQFQKAFFDHMAFFILLPLFLYFLFHFIYSYVRYGNIRYTKFQNMLLRICLLVLVLFGILRNFPTFSFLQPGSQLGL